MHFEKADRIRPKDVVSKKDMGASITD